MSGRRTFLYLCAIVFLALVNRAVAQSEPPPRFLIISPSPGEVISGSAVKVIVRLPSEITLDDHHVHLWLDALPEHDSELAVSLEETPEYTYANVFSGLHKLYAEVYRNDHLPLDRKMLAEVEFETADEELKPAPNKEGSVPLSPNREGGSFIPAGGGNTLFSLVLITIFVALLWYRFGRSKK